MKHCLIRIQPILAHPMVVDGRAWVVAVSVDLSELLPMFLLAQCVGCLAFSWTTLCTSPRGVTCSRREVDRAMFFKKSIPALLAMSAGALFLQVIGFVAFALVCIAVAALDDLHAQRRWGRLQEYELRGVLGLPVRLLARAPVALCKNVQEASPWMPAPLLHTQEGWVSLHASMACRRWMTQRHWAASLGWSGQAQTFWVFPSADQILRHFSLSGGVPRCSVRRDLTHARAVNYDRFRPLLVSMGWNGDEQ